MVSTTSFFVGLQQVYQQKAAADRVVFKAILSNVISVRRSLSYYSCFCLAIAHVPSSLLHLHFLYSFVTVIIIQEATRSSVPHAAVKMTRTTAADIADETIDIFCKNIFNLRSVTTRTLAEERAQPACEAVQCSIDDPYDDPAQTPIHWYIALRAVDRFHSITSRWPGASSGFSASGSDVFEDDSHLDADADIVWSEMQKLMQEYGLPEDSALPSRDHAVEIVRYGGGELHAVSALVGGVAAQEAVKIITHQYVPLNNTFIYNGVAGCAETYEL
jgi:hypothetical protein